MTDRDTPARTLSRDSTSRSVTVDTLQYVILEEGTYHGQLALAPPPPATLRLGVRGNGETATELYMYVIGKTERHPEHGTLPIMVFVQRDASAR